MSTALDPIDLHHQGRDRVIGVYLVETEDGPALHDCGPASAADALKAGLGARGLALTDVRHLLLSHIHLDHAGAAGVLVREHPGLQVHVSEVGAPHLVDPSRLEASARRLYGDRFDTLWGELAPVPEANVRVVGVRLGGATFVMPPCPPPEFDLDAWEGTIVAIERRGPARLALIHFGVFDDVQEHLAGLRDTLGRWSERVDHGMDEQTFVAAAAHDVAATDPDLVDEYQRAGPYWHHFRGIERYWRKRREAAAAG